MGIGCTGRTPIMYLAYKPILWVCYVLLIPTVAFGLFGNILSFKILGYNRSRRNQSSTFYLRALAIADSLTLALNTTLMAQQMMLRPALNLHPLNFISQVVGSYPYCNLRMYTSHTTALISVYIIVLFSIERALVVIDPFRWMRFFNLRKARCAVAALSVTCCLICIPSLFSFNKEYFPYPVRLYNATTNATIAAPQTLMSISFERCFNQNTSHLGVLSHLLKGSVPSAPNQTEKLRTAQGNAWNSNSDSIRVECQSIAECRINFPLFKRFILFHNISLSIVPFILTGICNIIIVAFLRRRETANLRKSKANEEQQDRQVTKKLIVVSTAFIVLSFPLAVYHIITGTMSGSYCRTLWANVMTITIAMSHLNYAVNFIIYCISEEQFRKLVVTVLLCKRHRLKRLLSYINEPRSKRSGGRVHGTGGGAGLVSGAQRKTSNNQLTNVTSYSISQCKDQLDQVPVTEALVHHKAQYPPDSGIAEGARFIDEDDSVATELAKKLEEAAADYVVTRHSNPAEESGENPHDFKNCSLLREDYASELFSDDVEDAKLRVIMARWSEVTPE